MFQRVPLWLRSCDPCVMSPFTIAKRNYERHMSPFFTSSLFAYGQQINFATSDVYAYYYQIINDLQTYYGLNHQEAVQQICSKWVGFDENWCHKPLMMDMMTRNHPFFYGLIIVFGGEKVSDDTDEPSDYKFCQEFNILSSVPNQSLDLWRCKEKFEQFLDLTKSDMDVLYTTQPLDTLFKCRTLCLTNNLVQCKLLSLKEKQDFVYEYNLDIINCKTQYKWKYFTQYDEWNSFVKTVIGVNSNEHDILWNDGYDVVESPYLSNPNEIKNDPTANAVPVAHKIEILNPEIIKTIKYQKKYEIRNGEVAW